MATTTRIRDDLRYGYAVGRVRVLSGRLLSGVTFERLLDAPDLCEQKRILAETHVGRYLEHAETAAEVERALDASLADLYDEFLERAELPAAVVKYFQAPHDFANLRLTVKSRVLGVPVDEPLSPLGSIPPEDFAGEGTALPASMRELLTTWDEAAETPDLDEVETLVDREMFSALDAAARASKVRFLRELTKLRIDLANARLLVRSRTKGLPPAEITARFVPGGSQSLKALVLAAPRMSASDLSEAIAATRALGTMSEADLTDIERFDASADSLIAQRMLSARRSPGGAEPVLAYVLGREAEAMLLRTVMVGRLAGLDREHVRASLRERI
ncbi:MAG: V-type ATPase subunit [Coriobacteriia bacterium]|nr:V-type ATPase subunit [Coriobacteriia bacterium]